LLLVLVQECLARTIFSPEQMVGEEGYKCESCKALREATKQLQLFTYPQVLLLGLKRFETRGGSKGGNRAPEVYMSRKVSTRVWLDARELLDLTPFCNPAGLQAAAAAGTPPPRYELIAVADHSGGLNGGHYTARGRCVVDGSWAEFNDSLVLGADAPSGSTSAAYMMLYRLAG
jgi:ubiquitin C-terminal hydrolase